MADQVQSVTYTSSKPPLAWRGTAAERADDFAAIRERTTFFEGKAREAALTSRNARALAAQG